MFVCRIVHIDVAQVESFTKAEIRNVRVGEREKAGMWSYVNEFIIAGFSVLSCSPLSLSLGESK